MNIAKIILNKVLENSSVSMGASYETMDINKTPIHNNPASTHSQDFLAKRYGCDKISDHHRKTRCMLRARLMELKKKISLCTTPQCKQMYLGQVQKWNNHYREEMRKSRYRKESVDLVEYGKVPSNILKDKNSVGGRNISKSMHLTVKSEITKIIKELPYYIDFCKKVPETATNCKNRQYKNAITKIENIKKECNRSEIHKTRCIKTCDSAIRFLSNKISQ
jgi:hypothetical protein